jgi:hypothetical protein
MENTPPAPTLPPGMKAVPTKSARKPRQSKSKALSTQVETKAEKVPPMTAIDLPIKPMKAALACASDQESRYYLNGLYVHAVDSSARIVATDGHRMFVYSMAIEGEAPEWLKGGVIVPRELLKEKLTLIEKLDNMTARVAYATGAMNVVLSDAADSCLFRMTPVDGTFPDYSRILDDAKVFEARELTDMASIAYQSKYLKGVGDIGKMLGSDSVRLFGASLDGEPSLITFPEAPGAVLVLMPSRVAKEISPETVKVISGSVNLTIAALKAHQTRWRERGEQSSNQRTKAECEAKVAEYQTRIDAIMAQINPPVALPPPAEKPAATETSGEFPEFASAPVTGDDIDGKQAARATSRSKLKAGARKQMLERFTADVNAILSRDHGTTLSQLADGVPIEGWFEAGLTAEEAAIRCGQWRQPETKKETVPQAELPGAAPEQAEPQPQPRKRTAQLRKRAAVEKTSEPAEAAA